MKNSLKYVLLIVLFIALVISVTVSTLYIKYEIKGEFKYNRQYYDIKYSNVFMDNDDIIVKVDENNNSCVQCPKPCNTCSNETICNSCKYEYNHTCYSNCPN